VNCQISAPILKSRFEFFDKKAFAADFREGFIQNLVPSGGHTQNLDITVWIELFEAIPDMFCLPHGQTTFTGGDN
jgi:hypothetical protein